MSTRVALKYCRFIISLEIHSRINWKISPFAGMAKQGKRLERQRANDD